MEREKAEKRDGDPVRGKGVFPFIQFISTMVVMVTRLVARRFQAEDVVESLFTLSSVSL